MTWSSDKPDIAKVDRNGKVTGVAEGTATIVVITADGVKTAVCAVTVADEFYTVKFDVQGHGTAPENQYAAKDGKIFEPADPAAEGYAFKGWYKEAACTNKWKFNADTVTANMTLYAKWVEAYRVSFAAGDGNGAMDPSEPLEAGTSYTIPANGFTAPTIDGLPDGVASNKKIFTCWNDGSTDKKVGESITVNSNIMLAAQWTNPSFSVSTDKKVYFAKGNLQATIDKDGKPTAWKFAENQYDYLGTGGANKTIGSAAGDIDLFGWVGTSGALNEYGISTSTTSTDYGTSTTETLKKDWGTAIDNAGTWRTLSKDEWVYLFNTRTSSTIGGTENARFAKVKVAGKAGILLFPDVFEWTGDMGTAPANCNTTNTDWTAVTDYTTALFEEMEKAGVVFLPAAGYRDGSSIYVVGSYGSYWSATPNVSNFAFYLYFNDYGIYLDGNSSRSSGRSVRLVCGEN